MTQKLQNPDPKMLFVRAAALAIGVGLAAVTVASWFGWAAKERSLEARARDRLR